MQYCGKHMASLTLYLQRDEGLTLILQHIVVFPVQKGRFINVVPFYFDRAREDTTWEGPELRDATRDEILKMYEGWEPEVQALLEVRASPAGHASKLTYSMTVHGESDPLGDSDGQTCRHLRRRWRYTPR